MPFLHLALPLLPGTQVIQPDGIEQSTYPVETDHPLDIEMTITVLSDVRVLHFWDTMDDFDQSPFPVSRISERRVCVESLANRHDALVSFE